LLIDKAIPKDEKRESLKALEKESKEIGYGFEFKKFLNDLTKDTSIARKWKFKK